MVYQEIDNTTPTTVTFKDVNTIINATNQQIYSVSAGGTPVGSVQNRVWATGNGSDTEASFRALVAADLPTDLTDGNDSTLHYHASDRSCDNHVSGSTNKVYTSAEQTKLGTVASNSNSSIGLRIASYVSGVTHKAISSNPQGLSSSLTMGDGIQCLVPIYLEESATLTGVILSKTNQGSYTGDNENSVALYTESGGTLTRVALGTGLEAIFENATLGPVQIPFSGTYAATAGIYWVGVLTNWSAVVTQNVIHASTSSTTFATSNRGVSRTYSGQTAQASSVTLSSTNASSVVFYAGLY